MTVEDVSIQLTPEPHNPKLLAYASAKVNAMLVRDIRIVRSNEGIFMSWPARRYPDGTYVSLIACTHKADHEFASRVILAAFEGAVDTFRRTAGIGSHFATSGSSPTVSR